MAGLDVATQAGLNAARLLAQAGIEAAENETAKRLQRLLLEELHHRIKNSLAVVIGITLQSLRTAETLEQGRLAVESRLFALGRAQDLLLQVTCAQAKLTDVIRAAIEPFENPALPRFDVEGPSIEIGPGAVRLDQAVSSGYAGRDAKRPRAHFRPSYEKAASLRAVQSVLRRFLNGSAASCNLKARQATDNAFIEAFVVASDRNVCAFGVMAEQRTGDTQEGVLHVELFDELRLLPCLPGALGNLHIFLEL
jgi:hypothetical protein